MYKHRSVHSPTLFEVGESASLQISASLKLSDHHSQDSAKLHYSVSFAAAANKPNGSNVKNSASCDGFYCVCVSDVHVLRGPALADHMGHITRYSDQCGVCMRL